MARCSQLAAKTEKCSYGGCPMASNGPTWSDTASAYYIARSPRMGPCSPLPAATQPSDYGTWNRTSATVRSASPVPSSALRGTRPEPSYARPAVPAPICSPTCRRPGKVDVTDKTPAYQPAGGVQLLG